MKPSVLACRALLAAAAALSASGCGYVAETAPVQSVTGSAPARFVAEKTGMATAVPEPKTFVVESRKPIGGYIPVGVTPPDRRLKARDPQGVEDLRKELEGTARAAGSRAKAD
jgi:hypothetical protein